MNKMNEVQKKLLKILLNIDYDEWNNDLNIINCTKQYFSNEYNGYRFNIDVRLGTLYTYNKLTSDYTKIVKYKTKFWSIFRKNYIHKEVIKILKHYNIREDKDIEIKKNKNMYDIYESMTTDQKMIVKLRKEKLKILAENTSSKDSKK